MINLIPLWLLFFVFISISMLSSEAGSFLARFSAHDTAKIPETPVGTIVGSVLALFAFVLAFSFSMTSERYNERKQLVIEDANAIGTAYLRAELIPSEQGKIVRKLLREYVDDRIRADSLEDLPAMLERAEEIHGIIWEQVVKLSQLPMDSQIRSLFITSVNEVFDLHEKRKTVGLVHRIPSTIWLALILLLILSMAAIGYQVSTSGVSRIRGTPILAACFALVMFMIASMDRPQSSQFTINQQSLIDLQSSMKQDRP